MKSYQLPNFYVLTLAHPIWKYVRVPFRPCDRALTLRGREWGPVHETLMIVKNTKCTDI